MRLAYKVFVPLVHKRYRLTIGILLRYVTGSDRTSNMFRIDFNFLTKRSRVASKPHRVSDATFRRKLETSDTLRHMCGFDTELYQAISDLRR